MRVLICLIILTFLYAACGGKAIRDPDVYAAEIQWVDMAHAEELAVLRQFLDQNCVCTETVSDLCDRAMEVYVVVHARWPYHRELMRYNGRLIEDRPPRAVPEIPDYPPHEVTCE